MTTGVKLPPDDGPLIESGASTPVSRHVGFVDCDAFPVQHQHREDFEQPPTPVNPPNSPTPADERSASNPTHPGEDLDGYDSPRDIWVRPFTTPARNEIPLVRRTRYTRLGEGGNDGELAVDGHGLNDGISCNGYPKTPSNHVSGVKGGPLSKRKVFRGKRRNHGHQLPKVPTFGLPTVAQTCTSPNTALQMRLIEKNRFHDIDSPKQHDTLASSSPRLEFINVINPLSPVGQISPPKDTTSPTSPQNTRQFDTDRLRLNYSLEEVRPELVRHPLNAKRSQNARGGPGGSMECGGGTGGKDFLLQKYIGDTRSQSPSSLYRPGYPDGVRKSGPLLSKSGHGKAQSTQSTQSTETVDLMIGTVNTCTSKDSLEEMSPQKAIQYQFFKQRTPGNFRGRCKKGCDEFVIRKEQITSSRLYTTVTSITVNRVPTGGFGQWKFVDCSQ